MDKKDEERFQQAVKEAKDLIKMLETSSVRKVSLEAGNFKIEIERAFARAGAPAASPDMSGGGAAPSAAPSGAARDSYHRILAPMVGTYYHSPTPGSKPFVEVGARVQQGQTVGIIEAMKIMNEVPSTVAGVVKELLVQNGQPVQYEQPLMVIDTTA